MRKDIVKIMLVILTLNLFLASTVLAPTGTVISVDPSLIQDNQIKPGAPILKSFPSADVHNASVVNDLDAYDKNPATFATISPQAGTTTTWYYFDVKTFNSTLTKPYITLDLNMNYSVTTYRGQYRFVLYVGSARVTLDTASTVNVTIPTVKTWTSITEPNDGLWNQTDMNNLVLRVEVRRSSGTTGWCTFKEYEAWASIPMDSFTVRINISDVTQLVNWQINMTFNPTVLQVVTVREGPFLKSVTPPPPNPPPGTTFAAPIINNTAGWVQAACVLKSYNYGGANGTGVLATFHFKAVAEGNSVLNFSVPETYLLKWEGGQLVDIPCEKRPGYFQYLIGDATSDGDVDIYDLYQLGKAYGSNPSSPNWNLHCDFNKDNNINRTDLSILSGHHGQT